MVETIKTALENAVEILGEREHTSPSLDAKLLLSHVLGIEKTELYFNLDMEITGDRLARFYKLVEERAEGYPLQYILKSQEFMGLEFKVEEGILVPRPDTEILVEKVIEIARERWGDRETLNILEIGTGSGAIAISLAHYIEKSKVWSVDIDETPVRVATENAELNGVSDRVSFLLGDAFAPVDSLDVDAFDIVVSNPPYIRSDEIDELQLEVALFEPRLALDGGEDGLDFYREISREAAAYLKPGGLLAFEIGHDQKDDVAHLMDSDYRDIETYRDYGGNDRVVLGFAKG